jgi:hypothetical protein
MSTATTADKSGGKPQQAVSLRYEHAAALQTAQFVVNLREDGLLLDCSSGPIFENGSTDPVLPIHTRLAMSTTCARRLVDLLHGVLERTGRPAASQGAAGLSGSARDEDPQQPKARFPKLKKDNG